MQTKVENDDGESSLLLHAATFEASSFDWDQVKPLGILNLCTRSSIQKSLTCGKILAISIQRVESFRNKMGRNLCVFKIGVTSNPCDRLASYKKQGFTDMWLIWVSRSVDLIHMLEASLILNFHKETGCRNKGGTGGEGCLNQLDPPPPPYFVYICGGRADQLRRVG